MPKWQSASVRRQIADLDSSFDIEPVGEMEVKGRTAPERVYRLVGTVQALATQA